MHFDLHHFISERITGRVQSLLQEDLDRYRDQLAAEIEGKRVLVVGGAGTIGSSFIKALLPFRPAALVVVDQSENGLTELTRDLRSRHGQFVPADYLTYPFDFGSPTFGKMLHRMPQFDIVAHFAAHKHVRSEKDALSVEAMLENNVMKTWRLLNLLHDRPPAHFFGVSTDKATRPVNVMGASKKLMEQVIMAYGGSYPVTTARFANVAFSNGSLLAGFLERLTKRQPLSSPSDVRRYFVSPEESGQLCLAACLLGNTREIFFPRLEEHQMMRFSDIASRLLEAIGKRPVVCESEDEARAMAAGLPADADRWPVFFFTSNTSGEKLFEEFHDPHEEVNWDRFTALGVIQVSESMSRIDIDRAMREMDCLFTRNDLRKEDWVEWLGQYVTDFAHLETGRSLDQRM